MSLTFEEIVNSVPKSNPFSFTFYVNGKTINVYWINRYICDHKHKEGIKFVGSSVNCRECIKRSFNLVTDEGENGHMLFPSKENLQPRMIALRSYAKLICKPDSGSDSRPILVTSTTYPPIEYTNPHGSRHNEKFYHWTVVPSNVTDPVAAARLSALWNLLEYNIDERLSKFLSLDARESIPIVKECLSEIDRPEIYASAIDWVINIQEKFPTYFNVIDLTHKEKMKLRIFAMMTGRAERSVHFDFSSSQNFISLLTMNSKEQVIASLNNRSSVENYQVSSLNRALADHKVSSPFTVSLVWDGKEHKDDLDLHVVLPDRKRCYWSCKNTGGHKLDFDAGVGGMEAEPVENITCSGRVPVTIQVDNFNKRTRGDVQATVIIRELGYPDEVIPIVWPSYRRKGDYLTIKTHTFHNTGTVVPAMTPKAAAAAKAQTKDFDDLIGTPTSTIATLANITGGEVTVVNRKSTSTHRNTNSQSVTDSFNEMVINAAPSPKKKTSLAHSCSLNPRTVSDLFTLIKKGGEHDLKIHLPDHSPGYITNVSTRTDKALKSGKTTTSISCHYEDKFKLPVKPVKPGTARLDTSWVYPGMDGKAIVSGMVFINGKYFLALIGAYLSGNSSFPSGGGFYPTDLSATGHVHRSRWTYYHSNLRPSTPFVHTSHMAIGTFLTGETATVFLDGKKIVLTVN